jgi:hypothetical protein
MANILRKITEENYHHLLPASEINDFKNLFGNLKRDKKEDSISDLEKYLSTNEFSEFLNLKLEIIYGEKFEWIIYLFHAKNNTNCLFISKDKYTMTILSLFLKEIIPKQCYYLLGNIHVKKYIESEEFADKWKKDKKHEIIISGENRYIVLRFRDKNVPYSIFCSQCEFKITSPDKEKEIFSSEKTSKRNSSELSISNQLISKPISSKQIISELIAN